MTSPDVAPAVDQSRDGSLAVMAIAGIGAFGGGMAVEASFANVDHAAAAAFAAPNVSRVLEAQDSVFPSVTPFNVLSNEAALTSSLQQDCIDGAEVKPQASGRFMRVGRPGQTLNISIAYSPMPEFCHGLYRRIGEFEAQLQDAKNHKRWRDTVTYNENGRFTGDVGGNGFNLALRVPPGNPWSDYECSPGPGITHERLVLRNRTQDIATSKIVGEQVYYENVDIHPKPC